MNHYKTLQIDRGAEPEVIEKAYRVLCLKYHPDVVPADHAARATLRMQMINEAYAVLSDPQRRAAYDSTLPEEQTAGAWEIFLDRGLAGMFMDWAARKA